MHNKSLVQHRQRISSVLNVLWITTETSQECQKMSQECQIVVVHSCLCRIVLLKNSLKHPTPVGEYVYSPTMGDFFDILRKFSECVFPRARKGDTTVVIP